MGTSGTSAAVAVPAKRSWRRHSDEFRARVIELARQPNVSVAAVALANGLNANMLRRWVRQSEGEGEAPIDGSPQREAATPGFMQLPMCAPAAASLPVPGTASVVVEIQRNGATVRVSLPLDSHSAAWLREVTG